MKWNPQERERAYLVGIGASLPASYAAFHGITRGTDAAGRTATFGNSASAGRYERTPPSPVRRPKTYDLPGGNSLTTYDTPGNKGRTVALRTPRGVKWRATKGAIGRAGLGLGTLGLGAGLSARLARTHTERRAENRQYAANRMRNIGTRARAAASLQLEQQERAKVLARAKREQAAADKARIEAAARKYEAARR